MDSIRDILRDFVAYLRRPALIVPAGLRAPDAWRVLAVMFVVNLLGLLAAIPVIAGWHSVSGTPQLSGYDALPREYLLGFVVLAAPLMEELVFRGWLTGRPRGLWLLVCAGIVAVLVLLSPRAAQPAAIGLLVTAAAALGGWLWLRRRPPPGWYARHFAAIFYAAVIVFGTLHMFNYGTPSLALLPLVLPQLWAGLTLGYTRMRLGLPASFLIHAASNGLVLGLALASGQTLP